MAFSRRPVLALVLPLALLVAGGCATKKDLKQVRDEVHSLQLRQDSLLSLLQRQNRQLMDMTAENNELLMRVRGDLGHQLIQMEQQLVQIQELTGQSQRRLTDLRQQIEGRSVQLETPPTTGVGQSPGATPGGATGAAADQLYTIGVEQLRQQAPQTARRAFEQILRDHPTHERAPDAQYQIGETYVMEQNYDRSMREFERVVELFPNSPRGPTALYRAGVVAEERGNIAKAREYFQRVVSGYPQSAERQPAEDKLRRLRRN